MTAQSQNTGELLGVVSQLEGTTLGLTGAAWSHKTASDWLATVLCPFARNHNTFFAFCMYCN